ncbi:PREDICTED: uncharacterized protein LOC106810424 [Priapulus caudatus]|uniref:Uncharacterized protein LOC106810424 n=1 Tax=Priapulus caudatus TaxID=37621 RepID=A0ABM1EAP2_PRICU|nr:PREDICTED: uncharacterized protein LOC106810424 [Priapulus caudatus]
MDGFKNTIACFGFLVIIMLVNQAGAIRCQYCSSFIDGISCHTDTFDKESDQFVVDCDNKTLQDHQSWNTVFNKTTGFTMCRKMTIDSDEGLRTFRDCAFEEKYNERNFWYISLGSVKQVVYQCDEELCNSVGHLAPWTGIMALLLVAVKSCF